MCLQRYMYTMGLSATVYVQLYIYIYVYVYNGAGFIGRLFEIHALPKLMLALNSWLGIVGFEQLAWNSWL